MTWFASCFLAFAVCKIVAMLVTGMLIDRFGAVRLMPLYPLSLMLGLAALLVSDHPLTAILYLGGAGYANGMFIVAVSIMWVELYGADRVGAIRGLMQSIVLVIIATATVTVGWLLDLGIPFNSIILGHIVLSAFTLALSLLLPTVRREHSGERL